MRIFLAAHRPRFHLIGIEQPGFLHHRAAIFDQIDLTPRFNLNRLHHETDRVHIFGLGARAIFGTRLADRHIDVGAH